MSESRGARALVQKPFAFIGWCAVVASLGCSEGPGEPQGGAGSGASATAGTSTTGGTGTGGASGAVGTGGAPLGGAPSAGGSGGRSSGGSGGTAGDVGGRSASGGTSGSTGAGAGMSGAGGSGGAGSGGMQGGAAGSPAGGASSMAGAGPAGGAGQTGAAGGPSLPPTTDYSADGPFDTTIDRNTGPNGNYTVFRPATLGENGFLHAPIVFGPGIGQEVTVHTTMLTKFASHGFVVVGCPVLSGGPGDAGNRMTMMNGLTWIIAQNTMSGGPYQGKLYPNHAISMGFSVGGTSAVEIGGHEAVATVVSIHGHKATAELHGTMLQTTGTQDTVGMPLQQQTYDASEVPTFLATLTGAPHQYIESNGGGNERPAIVAWMRYWIYGDTGAESYFFGDDCVLCKAPWENPKRKNWP